MLHKGSDGLDTDTLTSCTKEHDRIRARMKALTAEMEQLTRDRAICRAKIDAFLSEE